MLSTSLLGEAEEHLRKAIEELHCCQRCGAARAHHQRYNLDSPVCSHGTDKSSSPTPLATSARASYFDITVVEAVNGSFKDAASEAFRFWVGDLENIYHLTGSAVGPHPCPTMVREFQSVIGKETRMQACEKWEGKPDVLVACVGTGSNALGLFHEFIPDRDVRLIGVEAAGFGLESGRHSSTLTSGEVGVYHGAMSYLLQDEEGQIIQPHSIAAGMEYPGVGPELSFLKESGRAEFYAATDQEALDAYERLCKLEGIFPSLEAAHALAILDKLVPTLSSGSKVVVNCSGRGDKDAAIVESQTL